MFARWKSQCLLVKLGLLGLERMTRPAPPLPPLLQSQSLLVKLSLHGIAKHSAMTESTLAVSSDGQSSDEVDVSREASRQEIEGAFMASGNGFITETGLRLEVTNMGAELMDDEVKCPTWFV